MDSLQSYTLLAWRRPKPWFLLSACTDIRCTSAEALSGPWNGEGGEGGQSDWQNPNSTLHLFTKSSFQKEPNAASGLNAGGFWSDWLLVRTINFQSLIVWTQPLIYDWLFGKMFVMFSVWATMLICLISWTGFEFKLLHSAVCCLVGVPTESMWMSQCCGVKPHMTTAGKIRRRTLMRRYGCQ